MDFQVLTRYSCLQRYLDITRTPIRYVPSERDVDSSAQALDPEVSRPISISTLRSNKTSLLHTQIRGRDSRPIIAGVESNPNPPPPHGPPCRRRHRAPNRPPPSIVTTGLYIPRGLRPSGRPHFNEGSPATESVGVVSATRWGLGVSLGLNLGNDVSVLLLNSYRSQRSEKFRAS